MFTAQGERGIPDLFGWRSWDKTKLFITNLAWVYACFNSSALGCIMHSPLARALLYSLDIFS